MPQHGSASPRAADSLRRGTDRNEPATGRYRIGCGCTPLAGAAHQHIMPNRARSLVALAALAAAGLAIAACSSGPALITAHGKVTVDYTDPSVGDDLSDGSQVVIVNSGGTVIGNGTLAAVHSGPGILGIGQEDVFSFKVTVPGGLPRYGIQVGGTSHGTLWESAAQMQSGPALSIDETTGGL